MSSLDDEIARLQSVRTSFTATQEQKDAAAKTIDKILDGVIDEAIRAVENNTAEYETLIGKLAAIVDRIEGNRIGTVLDEVNQFIADVNTATTGTGAPDPP